MSKGVMLASKEQDITKNLEAIQGDPGPKAPSSVSVNTVFGTLGGKVLVF